MPAPQRIEPTAVNGYAAGQAAYALELYPSTTEVSAAYGEKVRVEPGRRYYFSAGCSRGTTLGTGSRLNLGGRWLAADGVTVVGTFVEGTQQTPTSLTAGAVPKQIDWSDVCPAGAAFVQLKLYCPALANSSGSFRVEKPSVSQVEPGATQQLTITNGPTTHSVRYDPTGATAEAGELPVSFLYKLQVNGVVQTSGVSFSYTVKTGTINGKTSADSPTAMSVTGGTGTFTISSLGTTAATVEITATYGASTARLTLTVQKDLAPPTTSGGGGSTGASKSSGFSSIGSTSFVDLTGTMTATLGSGKTQLDVGVGLNITPLANSPSGTNPVEMKVQRNISGTWTDQGSLLSTGALTHPKVGFDSESSTYFVDTVGNISGTVNITGLTAGSYDVRVVGRYVSGSANHVPMLVTGTVTATIP